MKEKVDDILIDIYQAYENKPIIKGLIQAIGTQGFSLGSMVDTALATYVSNIRKHRLHIFFEELSNGNAELTEDIIENNDFLHAFFSTINYVFRTRSDDKIKRFARILKNYSLGFATITEFEDFTSIFNELSDREFTILVIKYHYEQLYLNKETQMNPAQKTNLYWEDFKKEIFRTLNISENELDPMLVRIQRTGCYNKHKGYWDNGPNERGNTTVLFTRLYELIRVC